MVDIEMFAFF